MELSYHLPVPTARLLTFSHERGCWMAKGVGACTHWLECSANAARHLFDAGYVLLDV